MESCDSIHTPGITNSTLPASEEHLLDLQGIKQYQAMVGVLIFLSQCTRFDIAFSATQVARYMSKPITEHLVAVKRIFRYLKGTPDLPIQFGTKMMCGFVVWERRSWRKNEVNIELHVLSGKWTYIFFSSLQRITALSTTEAEPIALARRGKFDTYLFNLLRELGWSSIQPPTIFSDSQGALHISSNANYSNKSKHLAIRFYSLKDRVNNDQLIVNYVSTSRQLADILIKYCEKTIHRRLLNAVVDLEK
ncbi:unnamed protein product [Sphacelaria rigidula]